MPMFIPSNHAVCRNKDGLVCGKADCPSCGNQPSQLEAAMNVVTLDSLIARARRHPGFFGVAVWNVHSEGKPAEYIAACIGTNDACVCDPRSWNAAPTIEGALAGLERAMDQTWGQS